MRSRSGTRACPASNLSIKAQELRSSPTALGSKTGGDRQHQNEEGDDVLQIDLSRELALMRNRSNGTKKQATFISRA